MERIITIANKDVKLSNNVAWTMEYRDQFGKDVVQEHIPLIASLTEAVAAIIADTGKTEGVTLADILEALQGRTMEILIPAMQTEFMSMAVNVTWAMAKAADESIDPPKKWVKQFDEFPLDVIVPQIYDMAFSGFVSSKNLTRLKSLISDIRTIQPSTSTPSSLQVLNEG